MHEEFSEKHTAVSTVLISALNRFVDKQMDRYGQMYRKAAAGIC